MNRKEAIEFINLQQNGLIDNLDSKIGKNLYRQFCLLGYIRQGVNGEGEITWRITEQGINQLRFYSMPTTEERNLGIYFASLGI